MRKRTVDSSTDCWLLLEKISANGIVSVAFYFHAEPAMGVRAIVSAVEAETLDNSSPSGNLTALVNTSGSVVERYLYDQAS
jgi:hypothetical protein